MGFRTKEAEVLVAVTGHASLLEDVSQVPDDPTGEHNWYLQSFQHGEVPHYINHMRRGAELVAASPRSLGLMSGGYTRLASGRRWSEAGSYLAVADHYNFWQQSEEGATDVRNRFSVEEFARDSLENTLFSVLNFRRRVGYMPLRVYMIGWEAKRLRFEHHARTLGIPDNVFGYEGVPLDAFDCQAPSPDMAAFARGESKARQQWADNPLGDSGPLLEKRIERNPFQITPPYTWAEYATYSREAGWQPSEAVLAAAALEGASAA